MPLARSLTLALLLATTSPLPAQVSRPVPAEQAAEARAAALVAKMTRAEKLVMVSTYFPPFVIGKPDAPADVIPAAGHMPAIPRLGIPRVRESDASLGVANQVEQRKGDTATALPAGLATAASFDPAIAYAGGAMIGAEARAKTFGVLLAGGVNLARDPFNGRNFEYLGEDPLLAGLMAGEAIRGVQSNHIVSTVKHFALNAQETGRMILDARIGESALRESDLLAFELAIERGRPGSVMCAYNKLNGDWACENPFLLTQVLRRDWSYKGFVMSDWGGVHSTAKAALAGLDQQSGKELDKMPYFAAPLNVAISDGSVPELRLDEMVRRILTGMIYSGLLDDPVPLTPQPIDAAKGAEIAQKTAESGIVLLKNAREILPLARTAKRIVVIGGHADIGVLSGGGSSQVRSVGGAPVEIPLTRGAAASFARITYHASSPLKAIQALVPNSEVIFVDYQDPQEAAKAARGADIVIVFATQWQTEAQDAETLALPDEQDARIAAVAAANRNTVVVLETGGPVLMPWLAQVPAVVQAWYPGQRGGEAIANILFGNVNPSGRLPITFPASATDAPRAEPVGIEKFREADAATAAANPGGGATAQVASYPVDYVEGSNVGYRWYAEKARKPLFSFGHGLSYTRFAYSDLKVEGGQGLRATLTITNTGKREGADVPQLYVAPESGGWSIRLAAFQRVTLKPGERRTVTLTAEPRILAQWDVTARNWHVHPGTYRIALSRSATDPVLQTASILTEQRIKP